MIYYTTTEQSKKLVELGLNPDTADMHYLKIIRENDIRYIPELLLDDNECDIPCWSLGALLELMPKIKEDDTDGGCCPDLCKGWDNSRWHCVYRSSIHITKWYENSIDAVFEMVCWLLKNGYIKKGE